MLENVTSNNVKNNKRQIKYVKYFLETCASQRQDINAELLKNVFEDWPILLNDNFFIKHAERLLSLSDLNKLYYKKLENFSKYFNYFKEEL